MNPVDLEDFHTWPSEVRDLLCKSLDLFRDYESERRRIDKQLESDLIARCFPYDNRYRDSRNKILTQLNAFLENNHILGWHCTRLHDQEVTEIKLNGLAPLTVEHTNARIERMVKLGEIPESRAKILWESHEAGDVWRRNQIWFVNSRSSLQDEGAVSRMFTSWGGEAVYRLHEKTEDIGFLLKGIGNPCIVVAALPLARYKTILKIAEYFVSEFLHANGIDSAHGHLLDGWMEERVPVSDVIGCQAPQFQELTQCRLWQEIALAD